MLALAILKNVNRSEAGSRKKGGTCAIPVDGRGPRISDRIVRQWELRV